MIRRDHELGRRCADVRELEVCEVASNPLAAGLAAKGSRVVHSHEGRTVYSCLLANLLFGIPYIITRRVIAPQTKSALRSMAYGRAAQLVGVSSAVVDGIHEQHPALDVEVIADASAGFVANPEAVDEIRGRRPGKKLIGHVGMLDHSAKGQSTIIEVARRVQATHPDWHFLLCGCGKDEQRFREEIGSLDNVELVGWVDNVGDYLASFDLFVFPSLHEALGSSLLDALQFGLPVVASNVGGIPGIIADGINGLLVEPEDSAALVEALQKLTGDDNLRRDMQGRNVELAREYSAGRMAAAYETLYESIQKGAPNVL